MNKNKVNQIFQRFCENNSTPKIELNYQSPYQLLIAVVLSAQSTDKGVNRVTLKLFELAPTPQQMISLGESLLKDNIKSIGLYNNKAKNIISLSKILVDQYNSIVPQDFKALCKLPGVGRKSANVLLNSVWGHLAIAVDTHVFRVSNRIGFCKTLNVLKTEEKLMKIIPTKWQNYAHHWLVLHGRYICKARKPQCNKCLINDLCEYKHKVF